jgi:hypothetical protein
MADADVKKNPKLRYIEPYHPLAYAADNLVDTFKMFLDCFMALALRYASK